MGSAGSGGFSLDQRSLVAGFGQGRSGAPLAFNVSVAGASPARSRSVHSILPLAFMFALLAMRPIDAQELVEIAVPLFVVVPVIIRSARWLWQSVRHLAVLDAVDGVVATWMALRALVEGDADVMTEVIGDDARFAVGDDPAADARRNLVVLLHVTAGRADHDFLHAYPPSVAGCGVVEIRSWMMY